MSKKILPPAAGNHLPLDSILPKPLAKMPSRRAIKTPLAKMPNLRAKPPLPPYTTTRKLSDKSNSVVTLI